MYTREDSESVEYHGHREESKLIITGQSRTVDEQKWRESVNLLATSQESGLPESSHTMGKRMCKDSVDMFANSEDSE